MSADVVLFSPACRSPFVACAPEQIDPVDLAVFDIEQAAWELAQVIHATQSVDGALALRRRIEQLIVALSDVEQLALVKANTLCR